MSKLYFVLARNDFIQQYSIGWLGVVEIQPILILLDICDYILNNSRGFSYEWLHIQIILGFYLGVFRFQIILAS